MRAGRLRAQEGSWMQGSKGTARDGAAPEHADLCSLQVTSCTWAWPRPSRFQAKNKHGQPRSRFHPWGPWMVTARGAWPGLAMSCWPTLRPGSALARWPGIPVTKPGQACPAGKTQLRAAEALSGDGRHQPSRRNCAERVGMHREPAQGRCPCSPSPAGAAMGRGDITAPCTAPSCLQGINHRRKTALSSKTRARPNFSWRKHLSTAEGAEVAGVAPLVAQTGEGAHGLAAHPAAEEGKSQQCHNAQFSS